MTRISPRVRVVLPAPESPTTPSTIGRTIGAAYLVLGLCARERWRRLSGASVVRAGLAAEWRSAIGRVRWRRSRYPGSGWVAGFGVRGWFRLPLRSSGSPGEHLWLYGPVLGSELVGGARSEASDVAMGGGEASQAAWRSAGQPSIATRPRDGSSRSDNDRLQVGQRLKWVAAADPPDAAEAAGASAEGQMVLPVIGCLVDVHETGARLVCVAQRPTQVGGEDRRQQPVRGGVGQLNRLLQRANLNYRSDRPKRLLPGGERSRRHAVEQRRRPVEVGGEAARALATAHRAGAALKRVPHVRLHLCGDRRVVHRPERGLRGERIAEPDLPLDQRSDPFNQLAPHRLVDQQALAGGAALSGAEKAGAERGPRGRVEIGVLEHHERAVAAHLEQQTLAGGAARNAQAGLSRADEADGCDLRMGDKLLSDDRPGAAEEVEDAGRELGLGDAFGQHP